MIPIRLLSIALALVLATAPARADIFDDLSGRFGATFNPHTCAANPHSVRFDAARSLSGTTPSPISGAKSGWKAAMRF